MPGKNNSGLPQLCLQLWPRFHLSRRAPFNRPFQKQTEPKHTQRHSPGKLTDFYQHKRLIMKRCIPITKPLALHYAAFQQRTQCWRWISERKLGRSPPCEVIWCFSSVERPSHEIVCVAGHLACRSDDCPGFWGPHEVTRVCVEERTRFRVKSLL